MSLGGVVLLDIFLFLFFVEFFCFVLGLFVVVVVFFGGAGLRGEGGFSFFFFFPSKRRSVRHITYRDYILCSSRGLK